MTTISALPTEILTLVDHFLNSVTDRINCMKVCLKWCILFRKSLLHWVRINNRNQFRRFYQNLIMQGHLVKILDIQQPFNKSSIIKRNELLSLYKLCPYLHTLHFNAWDKLFAYPQQIQQLTFALKSLDLTSISIFDPTSELGSEVLHYQHSLTELSLSINMHNSFVWLLLLSKLTSLTLHITHDSEGTLRPFHLEVIHQACPKLRFLCIFGNSKLYDLFDNDDKMNINQALNMTTFKLINHLDNSQAAVAMWIQYICSKYPNLQTLEIENGQMDHDVLTETANSWEEIIKSCPYLNQLSLYGFSLNTEFYKSLLEQSMLKNLKLYSPGYPVPLTSLLFKYQKTLTELSFWPCHMLQTLNFKLYQNLGKLHISGIHMKDDWLNIPIDTLLQNTRLYQLTLDYLSLSQTKITEKTQIVHVSFGHVTLTNAILNGVLNACPRLTHLSLVYCQFLNLDVNLEMPFHRLEFLNLHQPYTVNQDDLQIKSKHIQISQHGKRIRYYETTRNRIVGRIQQEKSIFIYIKLHCFSVDQLYLLGSKVK